MIKHGSFKKKNFGQYAGGGVVWAFLPKFTKNVTGGVLMWKKELNLYFCKSIFKVLS
jgi:hypothetical protein